MLIASSFFYFKTPDSLSCQTIYKNAFDHYLPDDSSLTLFQRGKRLFYKELLWFKIKNHPEIVSLFTPLQKLKSDDSFEKKLAEASLDPIYLQRLRQTCLYVFYSIPLIYEIAGMSPPASEAIYPVELSLPPSRLRLQGEEIIHQDGEIDFLVIGSGPAGSVIAHELARQGKRVVLMESASFVKPLSTVTEFSSELIESENRRRTKTGSIIIRNGATVGGGTTVNLDLAFSPLLPQIKAKLKQWVADHALPPDFFHEPQQEWKKLETAYAWVKSKVLTRTVGSEEINANNRLLKEGCPSAKVYDLNARKPTGLSDATKITKVSATEAFIVPALKGGKEFKEPLQLISDAKATKIQLASQGVTGVQLVFSPPLQKEYVVQDLNKLHPVTGKEYTLKAKGIIVSAGTLGSAELLLRSHIPNKAIGKGIVIHPSMGIVAKFGRDIRAWEGLSASVYAPGEGGGYFFEAMAAAPNFIATIHPGTSHQVLETIKDYNRLGGFGLMLVDSVDPNNQVSLDPRSSKVDVHYHLTSSDKQRMKAGLKLATQILFQQGAQEVFIPTAEKIYEEGLFHPFTAPEQAVKAIDQLELREEANFISSAHMQGSNKLGQDPLKSVVSPHFKVWDSLRKKEIPNLYVCDSSVFPTSVGANPMQSIYTIAKLFADRLQATTPS